MSNILVRTLTGAVFISLVIFGLAWNVWTALGVMGLFATLGIWEFYSIMQTPKSGPEKIVGTIIATTLFILMSVIWIQFPFELNIVVLSLVFILPFFVFVRELYRQKEQPLQNVAVTVFGWLYVTVPLFLLASMRGTEHSSFEAIYPIGMLLIVWTNDTFAYLCGRFFGKTPLSPRISPNKTWEGTVGGILFSVITGVVLWHFTGIDLIFWVVSALIIAPAAIFGDLFESLIKRSVGIKDSGKILPGHGGILDRFDATLFAAPLFFIFHLIYFYIWN